EEVPVRPGVAEEGPGPHAGGGGCGQAALVGSVGAQRGGDLQPAAGEVGPGVEGVTAVVPPADEEEDGAAAAAGAEPAQLVQHGGGHGEGRLLHQQIGRASCRERVWITVGTGREMTSMRECVSQSTT